MDKMESRGTFTEYLPSYTVGVDAYQAVPHITRRFGKHAVVIGGATAMEKAKPRLLSALQGSDVLIDSWVVYGSNATHANARSIAEREDVRAADMLFLMGGGRAIDEGKEIATILDKPYFTFPTLASNCAPITRIAVFYKEDGSSDTYFIPAELPVHTFIDTQVIVESPDEYFWAGIGDAFSKGPEVELSSRDVDLVHSPLMGRSLAGGACVEPLFDYAEQALADKRAGIPSDAFERVVLNIIVTAGVVSNMTTNLAAERGAYYFNSSAAHAFYNGFTILGERAEKHLHGEVVSFGTCVLYSFDNNVEGLKAQVALNEKLGLPTTLASLDITELSQDADLDALLAVAQKTNEWGRAPYGYTPERFRQAILDADAYGRARKAGDTAAEAEALAAVTAHAVTPATAAPRRL
ncbi:iron-containing alcohol dehydrogenase family protein [Atopobium sp. oral taxon 199]|uniref:iron-containing alcohol dehydrogenase family protein n=1 Tax=Atopobium sp. oral taxon 199 TaxID=712156 RepID=UPI00034EA2A2|nr:iron-containing alcohol dehydrogenase family protein [Atopobium sp. oral taxon 199]EPD78342.1 glycerol dehydrogenase [Atopobium sp. oral taxon 199 str. F0494]